jgi:hypothetical protein
MSFITKLVVFSALLFSINVLANDFGTFVLVKGKVYIESANTTRVEAKVNSKIFEGQLVTTETDSRAKIVMSDRNIINVLPNTKLKIEKYRASAREKSVSLNLIEGRVRTNVEQDYDNKNNKFEVRTSTAVAGVRGTQFITSYNKANQLTEVVTIKGRVNLMAIAKAGAAKSLPVEVSVARGEKVQITNDGQASDPVKIPKKEFKSIELESNVIDEEKRKKLDQTKLEDSENIVGGVNSDPLNPQNNLLPVPQTQIIRDNKGKVNVTIDINK